MSNDIFSLVDAAKEQMKQIGLADATELEHFKIFCTFSLLPLDFSENFKASHNDKARAENFRYDFSA